MTGNIVVFSACGSAEQADQLARALVERHLAACVNVVSPVRSYYRWEGKLEVAEEWLLVIKTSSALFEELRKTLEAMHSYQVPEVVALPVISGAEKYLRWMEGELKQHG